MVSFALILVVAALHLVFMVVETFLWTSPGVRRRFGQSAEEAEATKVLAGNQGVYNGALGAALIFAAVVHDARMATVLLAFVIVVGIYGAATAKRSILFVQALPAAIALTVTQLGL